MPDQIYTPGPDAAPLLYTIPGSQQMVPRAFQALFDGTNASGDYVPTVVLRSQAGHVIARAILDETVTAGASAEVSWFPGVKHAAAGTATPLAYARGIRNANLFGDPALVVAPGSIFHPFPNIEASDSTVFTWLSVVNPNDQLQLDKNGLYAFIGSSEWENTAFVHYGIIDMPIEDLGVHGQNNAGLVQTLAPAGFAALWTLDVNFANIDAAPTTVALRVFNGDVVNRNLNNATFGAVYLGAL